MKLKFFILSLTSLWCTPAYCAPPTVCQGKESALGEDAEAVVVALLALRSGANCSQVQLQGTQQLAALESTVKQLNSKKAIGGLSIGLRVFDTCNEPGTAVKATLRSLVLAERTCLQPPLFLGFLGPTESSSLDAVASVTEVFGLNHVVPFAGEAAASNVLHVTSPSQPRSKAQAILTVLQRLSWSSVMLIHTADYMTTQQADYLVRLLRNFRICLAGVPIRLPTKLDVIQELLEDNEMAVTGIVILAGQAGPVSEILLSQEGRALLNSRPVLLGTSAVGLLPDLALLLETPAVVVQDSMNLPVSSGFRQALKDASTWTSYIRQRDVAVTATTEGRCSGGHNIASIRKRTPVAKALTSASAVDECAEFSSDAMETYGTIGDASLVPLEYGLRLYASAASTTLKARCGDTSKLCDSLMDTTAEQWRNVLRAATVATDGDDDTAASSKITFNMEMKIVSDVYLRVPGSGEGFKKIGNITGSGNNLQLPADFEFPTMLLGDDTTNMSSSSCFDPDAPSPTSASAVVLDSDQEVEVVSEGQEGTASEPEVIIEEGGDGSFDWFFNPMKLIPKGDEDFYQMVAILSGVGVGLLLFLILCVYIVYASFRVPPKEESKGAKKKTTKTQRTLSFRTSSSRRSSMSSRRSD